MSTAERPGRIAVLIPCHNEAQAIASVVAAFQRELPEASIYVFDNASTDATARIALEAGALVRSEPRLGKGNVVRRMFADIDADCYVVVDGDGTYDATKARSMIRLLHDKCLDMVVGARNPVQQEAYRPGHTLGNRWFNALLRWLFGSEFRDVFSGYRVLSRRLVKSFPTMVRAFEIEAELTIHALEIRAPWAEVQTDYAGRVEGAASKLNTYRDGARILLRSLLLYKEVHPGRLFGTFFLIFAITGLVLAIPVLEEFARSGQVPRFPTAILAASLELLAALCLSAGIILDSIARRHRELKRLHYLSFESPGPVLRD